jgi:hypothetical protein
MDVQQQISHLLCQVADYVMTSLYDHIIRHSDSEVSQIEPVSYFLSESDDTCVCKSVIWLVMKRLTSYPQSPTEVRSECVKYDRIVEHLSPFYQPNIPIRALPELLHLCTGYFLCTDVRSSKLHTLKININDAYF